MERRKKIFNFIPMAIMLGLFVVDLFIFGSNDVEWMNNWSLFNIGYNVIAMFLAIILFICCVLDGMQSASDRWKFLLLIFFDFICMALDSATYFMEGVPSLRYVQNTAMSIVFLLDFVIYYLILEYVTILMDIRKERTIRINLFLFWIGMIGFGVMAILNLFTPVFFEIDAMGYYGRGPLYVLTNVFRVLIALAIFVILSVYRKRVKLYKIAAAAIFSIATIILMIADEFFDILYIDYGVILLLLVIFYVIINVENGDRGAVTDREFATAKSIQAGLLPNLFPDFVNVPEYEIYALMSPAREVGGDFYDFFMLDEKHFAFLIGDVSSHDVGGALFMAISKSMLNMGSQLSKTPAEVLNGVNKRILDSDFNEMHTRVWLAFLDISTGHLMYSGAGIPKLAVQDQEIKGEFRYEFLPATPALGETVEPGYKDLEVDLVPGDRIFLFTSGILSACRKSGETYGNERMLGFLNRNLDKNNEELCRVLQDDITEFWGEEHQPVDITMLCFTFKKFLGKEGPA